MKKQVFGIISAIFIITLLSGCGQNESGQSIAIPAMVGPEKNIWQRSREQYIPLTFYGSNGKSLVVDSELVSILDQESRAEVAIAKLLEGTDNHLDQEGIFAMDQLDDDFAIRLQQVQVSNNVANVYLYNDSGAVRDDASLVKARTAIANTLIDYLNIDYVNLFFNQKPSSYHALPLGAMERYEGNPESYLFQIRQQAQSNASYSILATLYFPDKTGTQLLPEIRKISLDSRDNSSIAKILIQELMKGPADDEYMQPIAFNIQGYDVQEVVSPIESGQQFDEEDATTVVETLKFQKSMTVQIIGDPSVTTLSEKAVASSIHSVLDLQSVDIIFSEEEEDTNLNQHVWKYEDLWTDMGARVPIYLPANNRSELHPSWIILSSDEKENPKALLQSMINLNVDNDDILSYPFPEGTQTSDIIDAFLSDTVAVVDISNNLYENVQGMNEQDQIMFIYSIVSTMTAMSDVQSVQFYVEGQNVAQIGDFIIMSQVMPDKGRIAQITS